MVTNIDISQEPLTIKPGSVKSNILYILYGSRTGNSESAAKLAWEYSKHLGIDSELINMKSVHHDKFKKIKNLLVAVSTHGEGDPPAVVENFYNYLHSNKAPAMTGVNFSVLALGDSSYNDYCKTGHDFRHRLLELGATEISPLVECDIDYEENAKKWVNDSVSVFARKLVPGRLNGKGDFIFEINKPGSDNSSEYYAKVLEKRLLTPSKKGRRIYHFSLAVNNLPDSFQPGDSFGIRASNTRLLTDKLLKTLHFKGATKVSVNGETRLLKELLLNEYEITLVTPVILKRYATVSKNKKLLEFLKNETEVQEFCENHDILDLVTLFPAKISPDEFISILRKLSPRLYSVASSPLVFPDELHLTAKIVEYSLNNRNHRGVCSVFLNDRVEAGDVIPIFHEPNHKFRLTEDGNKPVIMIAAGTGIAPFRGFLQEREYKKAKGKNWLIFGDRYSGSDFLYGEEIRRYHQSGLLTNLSLAFSRDQKEKKYVQHLLLENSREVFNWIHQENAVIYLCGNKRKVGKEVKNALKSVMVTEGNFNNKQANDYWEKLKQDGRFLADVY